LAEVVQLAAKGLGMTWNLHTACHLQSSGKGEHLNRTLKFQLGKLCQEPQLQWDQLLPGPCSELGLGPPSTRISPFGNSFWASIPFRQGPVRGA
jgi:hypothetical protein